MSVFTLFFYSILCAAMFYLGSRAKITSFLWSRYPPSVAAFADCAACSGFWYGFMANVILGDGTEYTGMVPTLADYANHRMQNALLTGLAMIVLVPIVAGLMQRGLENVGSAIAPTESDDEE